MLAFFSSCAPTRYVTTVPEPLPGEKETVAKTSPTPKPPKKQERFDQRTIEREEPAFGFEEKRGEKKQIIASWYGQDFHGKPTASGEPFNMYALTCAHKEYAFGTKLRVMNTLSKKEVDCIVNDRGPFISGRDLDLSYAAAKNIDMVGTGTAPVIIEPLGRDLRYIKYIRYGALTGTLTIQAGSFRDESNAKRLRMALELNYRNVYIIGANVNGTQVYRVRIGKFGNREDARKVGNTLAQEGYNVLITQFQEHI